jgi:hypothetical protein
VISALDGVARRHDGRVFVSRFFLRLDQQTVEPPPWWSTTSLRPRPPHFRKVPTSTPDYSFSSLAVTCVLLTAGSCILLSSPYTDFLWLPLFDCMQVSLPARPATAILDCPSS